VSIIIGSLLCMFGGLGVGSFLLPLKFSKAWKWENSWLVGAFLMYVLLPAVTLFLVIPRFDEIYGRTPLKDLGMIYVFGLIQGTGSLIFTYGTTVMGLALGYALMIGCISLFGLLVPLFGAHFDRVTKLDGVTLLIGCAILIVGIGLSGWAGLQREAIKGEPGAATGQKKLNIPLMVIVVLWSGFANAMFYFTFEFQQSMKALALSQYNVPLYAWGFLNTLPFFLGMFTVNLILTTAKMVRDKSLKNYWSASGLRREYLLGASIGVLWYVGQGVGYTMGQAVLGPLGVAVGAALFMGTMMVVSNVLGVRTGEWKGVPSATMRKLYVALVLLVVAMSVIAIGNYLQQVVFEVA
jgi:L-rhamnose-H+ transport protein